MPEDEHGTESKHNDEPPTTGADPASPVLRPYGYAVPVVAWALLIEETPEAFFITPHPIEARNFKRTTGIPKGEGSVVKIIPAEDGTLALYEVLGTDEPKTPAQWRTVKGSFIGLQIRNLRCVK